MINYYFLLYQNEKHGHFNIAFRICLIQRKKTKKNAPKNFYLRNEIIPSL